MFRYPSMLKRERLHGEFEGRKALRHAYIVVAVGYEYSDTLLLIGPATTQSCATDRHAVQVPGMEKMRARPNTKFT